MIFLNSIYILVYCIGREGNGTPLQYSCLENPMDGGAWWAAVHGVAESDFHFSLSCIGEGNGNPLQCSCLENPRDGGAWWAAVYGVAQSQTRLKWLSSSSSILYWYSSFWLTSLCIIGSSFIHLIRKLWYIYTMEYYSAIKKNTFESVLMRWMKLESIIQN